MSRTSTLCAGASALALAAFAALPSAALAQVAVPPPPSPDAETAEVVVTASRSGDAVSAELLGESATVVTAQDLQDRQTRVVSDVLRDVPGVEVNRTGAVGGTTQVRIRGAESNQTLVLVDGIKVSDPFSGEFDFGTLIADEDARIEVLRGQQSSLYGSDAIGGVVQYLTLTGAEAPGVKLRVGGGSMGTFEGGARVAGVAGKLDYAFNAAAVTTGGYPTAANGSRDVGSQSATASAKLIWTPAPNLHLTGVFRYERTAADTNDQNFTPRDPLFGLVVDSPGVGFVNDAYYGLVRGQLDSLGGRWTNAVTLQTADTTRTDYDTPDFAAPPAGQPVIKSFGDEGRRFRGSYESSLRLGDEALMQRITFATDAQREDERQTVVASGQSLVRQQTTNIGLVGEYELTAGNRFALGGSVRRDMNDRFADTTTYRVQGSYLLPLALRVHAAAGSGVVAPTFRQLFDTFAGRFIGNPNLQPEKSQGWEAGLERRFLDGRASASATFFRSTLRDEVETAFTAAGPTPFNAPTRTHQQGVELAATARVLNAFRVDAAYTYLDAPQTERLLLGGTLAAGGRSTAYLGEAVRRARNIGSVNLTWAPPARPYTATVTVRYNGDQNDRAFTDPSFEPVLVRLHDFTLVNLSGTYDLSNHLQLYGRVENLFDQNYVEVYSFRTPGIAGYAGVKARF